MALRILKGEKIENIPVVRKSPTRYMFDYQQMERFGIKRSALPPESVIINEPVSFYAVNKSLVWGSLAGIIGLIFIVIVLLFNFRQRKKAEKELREARDELENRVRERTSELANSNDLLVNEIVERKQAEALLKESEEKYRRFFSTSRDCVFMTSKDGNWIDLNEAAVEIFGYSSCQELMQMKIPELYANPEERAKHLNIITEHGYTKEFPVDMRRKDGTVMHTLITSVALYDAEGNVTGFQGTIRDITNRRRAEEEREKLILELREAMSKIKTLSGMLPICASCKKIRDDNGYWNQIESYIKDHSEAEFSHSICPDCAKRLYPELYK
ncbi:MAG: PAS domain S-box protein [Syntrophaceae bacterium]|nr:PAS domain S-box protein [Syntrophaceae bacterium]